MPQNNTNAEQTINPFMVRNLVKTDSTSTEDTVTYWDNDEVYDTFTLSNSNDWQHVAGDLETVVTDTSTGAVYEYSYFIEEVTDVEGFTAYYSPENTEGITGGVLTVTNKSDSPIGPLPETGGRGSPHTIRIIGFSFAFISMAVYFIRLAIPIYKKRRKSLN